MTVEQVSMSPRLALHELLQYLSVRSERGDVADDVVFLVVVMVREMVKGRVKESGDGVDVKWKMTRVVTSNVGDNLG